MPATLIPIFCTSEVSVQTLSELLEDAYAEGPDSPDSLLLVHDKTTLPSAEGKELQPTISPVSIAPSSEFYGATTASLVAHVQDNAGKGPISGSFLLVVDKQTAEDKTVLLVECPREPVKGDTEGGVESVRVASGQANAPVVAMQVGSGSLAELRDNVGEDSVYRGGKGPPPKKGKPAPRKKLGGES